MSSNDFKECIPKTIEIAQHWLWLKKSAKEKIIESFNNIRDGVIKDE